MQRELGNESGKTMNGGNQAFEDRSVDELREEAKKIGLVGFHAMNKSQLIQALKRHNVRF